MILPRSLTWMHLLPRDAGCTFMGDAGWLRDAVEASGRTAGRCRVIIAEKQSLNALPAPDGCAGLVLINGSGITNSKLQHAGFSHIRRFAAVPNLQEARWFLPLDAPAVTSAAFCLYTPFRLSARAKLAAARACIAARLPIWYRDEVVVALRNSAPLEAKLAGLFPQGEVRLALSSGAIGPDHRRKPSIAVLDLTGRQLAFAKIAGSDVARDLMKHEARVLPALEQLRLPKSIAPRLLLAEEIDGTFVLAQTPIEGKPAGPAFTPAHREFLESLKTEAHKPADSSRLIHNLREAAKKLPSLGSVMSAALEEAMPVLRDTIVPATITHTDVVPWNLRNNGGTIAAFDWDTAELDGLPLFDEMHHEVMVGYCIDNWPVQRAAEYLSKFAGAGPEGLRAGQVRAIEVVYLVHSIVRLVNQGHAEDHEMVEWYRQVLGAVRSQEPVASPVRAAKRIAREEPVSARGSAGVLSSR